MNTSIHRILQNMELIDVRPITSDAYLYLKVLVTHNIIFKLHEVFALIVLFNTGWHRIEEVIFQCKA